MQVADLKRKKKRRRTNRAKVNTDSKSQSVSERRKDNDPLLSGDVNDLGIEGEGEDDDFEDPMEEANDDAAVEMSTMKNSKDTDASKNRAVLSTTDGTGRSTSGRNAWKEKRRKGKFNQRKQKNKSK